MKHTLEKVDNRITEAEGWISELEDRMSEVTAMEENKEKRMKRNKDSFRDLWENIQWTNIYIIGVLKVKVFLHGSPHRESACNAGGLGVIPGMGRAPGKGNGNPLQYSGLENSMGRGAEHATVHGVAESQTQRSD